ncbi:DUF4438 domain-containing protein [Candidatus Poribacteria bacterium]|nr:DUF4438 domain-containing protein [Candidatus Poribacteria bacterium]
MIHTNADKLIRISVCGEIDHPSATPYRISSEGIPMVLPGVGGITYNLRIGDPAVGWMADHVEPGVSIKNSDGKANDGLNTLACIGNEAIVVSGEAKGAKGVVVGKHGGIEHVLVDFPPDVLDKLMIGDKILVKAYGVGLKLIDFPDVKVMNLDPSLLTFLEAAGLTVDENGDLVVPVTHRIPSCIMGSGLGSNTAHRGDYDIQLFDESIVKEYGLEDLRLGDLVVIIDADNSFGPIYKRGAVTIGIVVHSDCVTAGHGPGVTRLMTSSTGRIKPKIDPRANIAYILKLR